MVAPGQRNPIQGNYNYTSAIIPPSFINQTTTSAGKQPCCYFAAEDYIKAAFPGSQAGSCGAITRGVQFVSRITEFRISLTCTALWLLTHLGPFLLPSAAGHYFAWLPFQRPFQLQHTKRGLLTEEVCLCVHVERVWVSRVL